MLRPLNRIRLLGDPKVIDRRGHWQCLGGGSLGLGGGSLGLGGGSLGSSLACRVRDGKGLFKFLTVFSEPGSDELKRVWVGSASSWTFASG